MAVAPRVKEEAASPRVMPANDVSSDEEDALPLRKTSGGITITSEGAGPSGSVALPRPQPQRRNASGTAAQRSRPALRRPPPKRQLDTAENPLRQAVKARRIAAALQPPEDDDEAEVVHGRSILDGNDGHLLTQPGDEQQHAADKTNGTPGIRAAAEVAEKPEAPRQRRETSARRRKSAGEGRSGPWLYKSKGYGALAMLTQHIQKSTPPAQGRRESASQADTPRSLARETQGTCSAKAQGSTAEKRTPGESTVAAEPDQAIASAGPSSAGEATLHAAAATAASPREKSCGRNSGQPRALRCLSDFYGRSGVCFDRLKLDTLRAGLACVSA